MRRSAFLAMAILIIAPKLHAQDYVKSQAAGKDSNVLASLSRELVAETGATARDLVTFRDRKWTLLTIAEIAAATADAKTSLYNLHQCATCSEIGISRFVVGRRPDAHKYAVAGIIEIAVEAVAAHYLRNHGPIRKWYWRYIWTLPQTFSLIAHTHSDFHNAGLRLHCDNSGLNCF
jgi:hypothetical protein